MKRVIFDDNSQVVNNWIGTIPIHWQIKRLKFVSNFISGYSFKADEFADNGIPVIRIGDIKEKIDLVDCKYWDELEFESLKAFEVKKDDILLALTGATIGKSTLYDLELPALLNQRCAILRPQKIIENAFLKHFIKTDIFREYINLECNGGAQGNIGKPEVGNFLMCLPTLTEQQTIAAFLDYKTKQIDDLIAKKEKLLKLLEEKRIALITKAVTKGLDPNVKMKPSGIEWLGDIPKHWEVKALKYIKAPIKHAFVDGPFGSNLKTEHFVNDGEVYVIESEFATRNKLELSELKRITTEHFITIKRSEVKNGDIIIAKIGAYFGLNNILHSLDAKAVVSGNSMKLTIPDTQNKKFIHYSLLFLKWAGAIDLQVKTTAQPALSLTEMNTLKLGLPSLVEQNNVVEKLESDLGKLQELKSAIQNAIYKLKEYRTSLITSAVTGKIDVRDFKPPREE